MNIYKKITLGSEANSYICEQLAEMVECGNTLAMYLLKTKTWDKGTVTTFFPQELGLDEAKDFAGGFKLSPKTSLTLLTRILRQYLDESASNFVVLNEPLLTPSDPRFPLVDPAIVLIHNDEVYYGISTASGFFEEDIQQAIIKASPGWYFFCTMTSVDNTNSIGTREITADDLCMLAMNAKAIAMIAYDSEGYLFWSESACAED